MNERFVDELVRRLKIIVSTRKGQGIRTPIALPRDKIELLERNHRVTKYGDRWMFEDTEVIEHAGPTRITKTHRSV